MENANKAEKLAAAKKKVLPEFSPKFFQPKLMKSDDSFFSRLFFSLSMIAEKVSEKRPVAQSQAV